MGMQAILVVMLFAQSITAESTSSDHERMVVRFGNPTKALIQEFLSSDYDVAAYSPGLFLDIVVTKPEYDALRRRGFDVRITQTEKQLKSHLKKKDRDSLEGYRDYEQMLTELREIEAEHPDICKLYDIGDTWGKTYAKKGNTAYTEFNHEIWAMKVSDNAAKEEDEPGIYYMGVHHAREPISMEMTLTVLHHIVDNYGKDDTIRDRVNDTQIWFIPLLNPNGHKVVTSESDVWWRKNIRDNNNNKAFDVVEEQFGGGPDGVDLNRNYGFGWGPAGSSDDPADVTYHGPEPWSEPEIQAVKNLLDSHRFLAGITYHTYGELVLYPYGNDYDAAGPDREALEELAVNMAKATPGTVFEQGYYDPGPGWGLYPTAGDLNDYSYGRHGTFSYTIEMADEFIPAADRVDTICKDNLEAAMIMLNRPRTSTLTGWVTDEESGEPVEAEIMVQGIDDAMKGMDDRFADAADFRYPYKSDKKFGRYYRMLKNGTYSLIFRAPGYETLIRKNIRIDSEGQTVLNIKMSRSAGTENLTDCEAILSGMVGGSVFIPLSGNDVDTWTIVYNGRTVNVPGSKIMHRIQGLSQDADQATIIANGIDAQGNPYSDAETCTIAVTEAKCPVNHVSPESIPQVRIGGKVTIPLKGYNADTWEITYNNKTVVLPGKEKSFELSGLAGGASEVKVSAKGFDAEGEVCSDEMSFSLNFESPTYTNPTMSPSSSPNPGDLVTLQIQTANAVSVSISDGLSISDAAMNPANSPLEPDFNNNWTFYDNTWTYSYTAFLPGKLTAAITGADGKTVTCSWDMNVRTAVRTVSGKVSDADTGLPLYAEIAYGPAKIWTDPLTGYYQAKAPDKDYDFTVKSWISGYQSQSRTVTADQTAADFALKADVSCHAPGYTVNALFYEPFDACAMPPGWTVKDNAGGGFVWTAGDTKGLLSEAGCYAISDSVVAGEADIDTELISPVVNCSDLQKVSLSFKYDFYTYTGSDAADVDISNDRGLTWANVWRQSGSTEEERDLQTAVIDISAQAAGKSEVMVRFRHYDCFYEWWLMIDEVKVYDPDAPTCNIPKEGGLVVGNISDAQTFINRAVVKDEQGNRNISQATPDDSNLADGFYYLYAPAGSLTLTASADGYISKSENLTFPNAGIVRKDFNLTAEPLDEMLDSSVLTWTTSGDIGWFGQREITNDGTDAAQSGGITDSQSSELSAKVYGPGKLGFFWKVSSEQDWDFLSFYIGDLPDPVVQISGESDWYQETVEIPEGEQVLRWVYAKDSNTLGGMDSAWIDQVVFDPKTPVTPEASTSAGIVTLKWAPLSAKGLKGYNIWRDGEQINAKLLSQADYTDKNPELWAMHCYSVTAVYDDEESHLSNEVCIMPHSSVIFVNSEAKGADKGDSWADAFTELQKALSIALPGDEIWVAAGTYTPDYDESIGKHSGDREATFRLKNGVAIYGGFDGTESSREERDYKINVSVLSGNIGNKKKNSDNSYHILTGSDTDSAAILDGFTVSEGKGDGPSWMTRCGAGIFNENGSPTLRHVVFSSNTVLYQGGAMYNQKSDPALHDVLFSGNTAESGGGMFNSSSSPLLTAVVFYDNRADISGGGMQNSDNSNPTLDRVTFARNSAQYGGATGNRENSNPVATNSIFWGNIAETEGSQIYDAAIGADLTIGSLSSVTYSIVEGGQEGAGNIDSDPLFADMDKGDLRLMSGSPASGAGKDGTDIGGSEIIEENALYHSADFDPRDYRISMTELIRIIQLFNAGTYGCGESGTGDGYAASGNDKTCKPHSADYAPQDWRIGLNEILRVMQFYTAGAYHPDAAQDDGFAPDK